MSDYQFEREEAQSAEVVAARKREIARLHSVFIHDSRAKTLLDLWRQAANTRVEPIDAPVQVYAAHEAVRVFVQKIEEQIALAQANDFDL